METVTIHPSNEILPGGGEVFEVAGTKVAVFNCDGQLHAIEDTCPHRGASLSAGTFSGTTVACPLHGWEFDVVTGDCRQDASSKARRFDVRLENNELRLEIPAEETTAIAVDDGISRYLVRYGKLGWVTWFGSIEPIECQHKDFVVINTSRGTELGEILSSPTDTSQNGQKAAVEKPTGELSRRATDEDLNRLQELRVEPNGLLNDALKLLQKHDIAVEVVDWERLLDGENVILYFLGEQYPELETVAEELTQRCELTVRFFPLIEPPPQAGGCGEGGCGSGGCGSGHG